MAAEIATNSATLVATFLTGMGGLDSAVMYTISSGITVYGFLRSIDFKKSNKLFWSGIEDSLDKEVFQKVAVPLYQAITTNLFDDVFPLARDESCANKKTFLENYEEHKNTKLKTVDFTFLNESLDFQNAITQVIDSRRNHSEYKKLKRNCRYLIMGLAAVGFLSLLTLIGSNITSSIILLPTVSNVLFGAYLFFIISAILIGMAYWWNHTKLDNLA